MGVRNLKTWREMRPTTQTAPTIFTQGVYVDGFDHINDELEFSQYELYIIEMLGSEIYFKIKDRRTYFATEQDYEGCIGSFIVRNRLKIAYYMRALLPDPNPLIKEHHLLEHTISNPEHNKETLTKTGTVATTGSGQDTEHLLSDDNNNKDTDTKEGTVDIESDSRIDRRFTNAGETVFVSDEPRTDGSNDSTQTFDLTHTKKIKRDQTKTFTHGIGNTTTNNTVDTKSYEKDITVESTERNSDPYSYVHTNDFVNKFDNLLNFFMTFYYKWTCPIER